MKPDYTFQCLYSVGSALEKVLTGNLARPAKICEPHPELTLHLIFLTFKMKELNYILGLI